MKSCSSSGRATASPIERHRRGAASVSLQDSIFAGTVKVETGAGSDSISVDHTSDRIPTSFLKAVTFLLGEDNDALNIGNNTSDGKGIFQAAVIFDGGAGNADDAKVSAAVFGNIHPAGQPVMTGFETRS